MKYKLFAAAIAAALISGCSQDSDNTGGVKTFHYDIADYNVSDVEYEEIPFSRKFIHAHSFYVYADSILVVVNSNSADNFIEFHNINTKECITKCLRKGNGPNEIINCHAYLYGDKLVVDDFVKSRFVSIDMDRLAEEGAEYKLEDLSQYQGNFEAVTVYPTDSGKLLMMNPYCFESKQLKIDNKEPRFYYNERKFRDGLAQTYNIAQGYMQINHRDSLIVFASFAEPLMELYDFNLNCLKKVTGPTDMKVTYHKNLAFKNHVAYSYMSLAADDVNIYALYVGNQKDNAIEKPKPYTHILRYDWDCVLHDVAIAPLRLNAISETSDENTFYASGYDKDGIKVLYKLTCTSWND